jgi:hypothetical protein
METREIPPTDLDLLVRIWTIIEGTNGSGLISRFACLEQDVTDIKQSLPGFWTRQQHDESINRRMNDRKISRREWWLILTAIAGPIAAVLIGILLEHKA